MSGSISDEVILCVANLSRSAQATELDLSAWKDRIPLEMLGRTRFPGDRRTALHDHAGALRLLLVRAAGARQVARRWCRRRCPNSKRWWCRWARPGCRWPAPAACSNATCCRVIWRGRRWYPERSPKAIQPTLISAVPFCDIGDNRPWLAFFEATQRGVTTRYVLPMQIEWVRFDRERYNPHALAAVRQGAREGTLLDVATDQIFIALLLRNLRESLVVEEANRACGWNSGRPAASPTSRSGSPNTSARSRPSNPTAPRWSTTTMSSRSIESSKPASIPRSRWAAS